MKNILIATMILLATATNANAVGYPMQPLNPHGLKPDLTPALKPLPPTPRLEIRRAAVSPCGLSDFHVACNRR